MLQYTTSKMAPFCNLDDILITTMIAYVIPRIGRPSSHILKIHSFLQVTFCSSCNLENPKKSCTQWCAVFPLNVKKICGMNNKWPYKLKLNSPGSRLTSHCLKPMFWCKKNFKIFTIQFRLSTHVCEIISTGLLLLKTIQMQFHLTLFSNDGQNKFF